MKAIEIINLLNQWAPSYLIEEWDNTGFQIGDPEKKIEKILIALDLDRRVFQKAVEEDVGMIITHHPIIFQPLKSITRLNYKEKLIYDIIKKDIVVYNAHTNLDLAIGGVNCVLAQVLEIKDGEALNLVHREEINNANLKKNQDIAYGYGRIGLVDEILLLDYLDKIKERLDVEDLIVYGDVNKNIKKVAVCGGSGSSFIYDAFLKGADLYITGDVKYHEAQYADELGLAIIDPGHYHTEKVILPVIKKYLQEKTLGTIEIQLYNESSPPYTVY